MYRHSSQVSRSNSERLPRRPMIRTCSDLEVSGKTGTAAGLNVVADNRAAGQTGSSG